MIAMGIAAGDAGQLDNKTGRECCTMQTDVRQAFKTFGTVTKRNIHFTTAVHHRFPVDFPALLKKLNALLFFQRSDYWNLTKSILIYEIWNTMLSGLKCTESLQYFSILQWLSRLGKTTAFGFLKTYQEWCRHKVQICLPIATLKHRRAQQYYHENLLLGHFFGCNIFHPITYHDMKPGLGIKTFQDGLRSRFLVKHRTITFCTRRFVPIARNISTFQKFPLFPLRNGKTKGISDIEWSDPVLVEHQHKGVLA